MLTRRGALLALLAVLLGLAARLFGIEELWALAAAALAALAGAAVWVRTRRWSLGVTRSLLPQQVGVGDPARAQLTARNTGRRVTPTLEVTVRIPSGGRTARFLVAPLLPGHEVTIHDDLPTAVRGVFELPPVEVALTDPFGLAQSVRVGGPVDVLTVHPRIEVLSGLPSPTGADRQRGDGVASGRSGGGEFASVREYRTGDDLRRVHWASTARHDELMIRQEEATWRTRLTIAVDTRAEAWNAAALERALSAAASLARTALARDLTVRVVTTDGADTGPGEGAAAARAVGDVLAAIRPGPPDRGASSSLSRLLDHVLATRSTPVTGMLVVVTSERTDDRGLHELASLGGRGTEVTVVLMVNDRARRGPVPAGLPVVRVDPGERFPLRWDRWVATVAAPAGRGR